MVLGTGLVMLLLGQVVRSTAMVQAGSNFNHTVQREKASGHELVTGGIYGWLRHPSYFGFFWWGLGTQVVSGNTLCLVGYAVVLWRFFKDRIQSEFATHASCNFRVGRLTDWFHRGRGVTRNILWGRICGISKEDMGWHTVHMKLEWREQMLGTVAYG